MNDPLALLAVWGVRIAVYLSVFYFIAIVTIWAVRGVLWTLTQPFLWVEGLVWFLYNPLRFLMKDHSARRSRGFFVLFSVLLVKPLYQTAVYLLTTPVRVITAIYFDVVMYLLVMTSDTIDELFNPKLGKMRHKKGFAYAWRWLVFLPYRFFWFVAKNSLAIVDSLLMLMVSITWPTFTMYHGTKRHAANEITQKGRWLVGTGNYAGSGIYFGRRLSTARHYSTAVSSGDKQVYPLIMARVTLTMVRNCGTLKKDHRDLVGQMRESGNQLSREVKRPYAATELWRSNGGKGWWEYCILRRGQEGKYVKSWRIRPVGLVEVRETGALVGRVTRLWGGGAHYCFNVGAIVVALLSTAVFFAVGFAFNLQAMIGFNPYF